jgi:hypothetical protein
MVPSPVGIEIAKHYRVGRKIGSGACANVYELLDRYGKPTEFAIKMAPLPKKVTKKRNSPDEMNASLIYHEQNLYQNHFGQIRGKYIPNIPSEVQLVYGDTNGKSTSRTTRIDKVLSFLTLFNNLLLTCCRIYIFRHGTNGESTGFDCSRFASKKLVFKDYLGGTHCQETC